MASGTRDSLNVLLVDDKPFWLAGDWLEGLVILELFDRRSVQRVELSLSGVESISWRESYSKRDAAQRLVMHDRVVTKHNLLLITGSWSAGLTLWGYPLDVSSAGDTALEVTAATVPQMHAGLYLWPFRIGLPAELQVASIENKQYGNIQFRLRVSVDTFWGPDIEYFKKLHVVPREPLYSAPDLVVPVWKRGSKQMNRYLFFTDGLIEASLTSTRRGFFRGEGLQLRLELRNLCENVISGVELSLVEQLAFKADGSVKNVEHVVVSELIQHRVDLSHLLQFSK